MNGHRRVELIDKRPLLDLRTWIQFLLADQGQSMIEAVKNPRNDSM